MIKAKESKTKTTFNDVFGVNETYFENKAHLTQEVSVSNLKLKSIEATLNYQACKEVCINLEKKFTFVIPADEVAVAEAVLDTTKVDTVAAVPESAVATSAPKTEKTAVVQPKKESKKGRERERMRKEKERKNRKKRIQKITGRKVTEDRLQNFPIFMVKNRKEE